MSSQPGLFDGVRARLDSPSFSLHQGDAVEWLASLAPGSVDLLIADPAYESLEKHRAHGTTTRLKHSKASSNDWFSIFPNARFADLFAQAYRALSKNSHFYLLCDHETMFVAKPIGEAAGFKFWKPIIWDKMAIGMGYHYRCRYEVILFFEKGKRRLNDLGTPDVLNVPSDEIGGVDVIEAKRIKGSTLYPTEKPVELLDVLVAQSSHGGELVADPFMGSGSTGEASLRLLRRFAGNDISQTSIEVARTRLSEYGREQQ